MREPTSRPRSARVTRTPKAHDGTITTEAPDVVGYGHDGHGDRRRGPAFASWPLTTARPSASASCRQARDPLRPWSRSARASGTSGASAKAWPDDHGSNYLADDFQQEVAFFGIESSPSFVREPEGNGVAERFIRTLKENLPLWVRSFATIEELRLALLAFTDIQRTVDAGEIR